MFVRLSLRNPSHWCPCFARRKMMAQDDFKARKLRPIYDAIDNRNYKQVNKLCQKKDIAGWSMTKVRRCRRCSFFCLDIDCG